MALQKNMTLSGGVTLSNCYVRIQHVEADRQNGDSAWTLKVLANVYKDADTRNATATVGAGTKYSAGSNVVGLGAVHLLTPSEYKFDYDPASEKGDLISVAYGKLKTHEDFSGASDV